ncbi:MAG TPA: hypothetical protein PLV50_07885 [Smithella sp.]|nr:hypothetical protein [Smithella sp.]MDM7985975.1 hypothetical protein [Smithella sp.]HNY49119.1 hypothetical protein [Smithella sp.]HOG90441.1 hypothetical protein [Smithella sp.]
MSKKILQKLESRDVTRRQQNRHPRCHVGQLLVYLCAGKHHPNWLEEYGRYLDPGEDVYAFI